MPPPAFNLKIQAKKRGFYARLCDNGKRTEKAFENMDRRGCLPQAGQGTGVQGI
jgi:hypothetical protein